MGGIMGSYVGALAWSLQVPQKWNSSTQALVLGGLGVSGVSANLCVPLPGSLGQGSQLF